MLRRLFPIIISALLFNGCSNEEAEPSFESRILGHWLVVSENYDQAVVEWGLFYIGSVKLYKDKSFKLNVGDQAEDPNTPKHGTWELVGGKTSIVFYSYVNDVGTIYRDTTKFKISLDSSEKLILENDWIKILHQKLSN